MRKPILRRSENEQASTGGLSLQDSSNAFTLIPMIQPEQLNLEQLQSEHAHNFGKINIYPNSDKNSTQIQRVIQTPPNAPNTSTPESATETHHEQATEGATPSESSSLVNDRSASSDQGGFARSFSNLPIFDAKQVQNTATEAPNQPLLNGLIQRKARDENGVEEGAQSAIATASSSNGTSLPETLMRKFESSLNTDLSNVRVHTGSESAVAASSVGARAYTLGQDIHFGARQYNPISETGQHLLAHEVAHTVQQNNMPAVPQFKLEVSKPGDALEVEADHAADAMVSGVSTSLTTGLNSDRTIFRDIEDPSTKALPADPSFVPADGSFGAMVTALNTSMKGGDAATVAPATGFAGSQQNLSVTESHAQASQTYYDTHGVGFDPGNHNKDLSAVAARDARWAIGMLADVRVATSATSSWVSLVNSSNDSWSSLVKVAESMSIDVHNKAEVNPLASLDGKQHAPTVGDQQVNANEVEGTGMGLAGSARLAGIHDSPDTTSYQAAMQAYNNERDNMTNNERRIISVINAAKVSVIEKKKSAATEERDKWEAVAKATDAFSTGLTVAIGGAAFVDGGLGAATIGDPGGQNLAVGSKFGTKNIGIQDNTVDNIVKTKEVDVGGVAEKGHSLLSAGIQMKIDSINKLIGSYASQLGAYQDVSEAQTLKANIGAYNDSLGKLRQLAKNMEDQQALMEKKLLEWAAKVDAEMIKQGKAPKGSKDNVEAAMLLAKIRAAATSTSGAIEGLAGGSASLPKLYSDLMTSCAQKQSAEEGRSDKRSRVFLIESGRWSAASNAITGAQAALVRRQTQITQLESSFLTTFAKNARGTDGPGSPGTKY